MMSPIFPKAPPTQAPACGGNEGRRERRILTRELTKEAESPSPLAIVYIWGTFVPLTPTDDVANLPQSAAETSAGMWRQRGAERTENSHQRVNEGSRESLAVSYSLYLGNLCSVNSHR